MTPAYNLSCRRGAVNLRLLAYVPALHPVPEGHLLAVVQVVEGRQPIAEDPLHVEEITETELRQGLELSRRDGWRIRPWKDAA